MDVALGLRAGDIGLVRAPRGVLGYPARWLGQRYEHAFLVATYWYLSREALVLGLDEYLNEDLQFVVEAGWTGVTLAELGPRLAFCDFVRPKCRENYPCPHWAVERALESACKHECYSYGNLLRLAWHRLILRRKPPALAAAAVICTQGVAQWWRKAGFDPVPGIADWAILPDDFWNSAAVERVEPQMNTDEHR